MRHARKTVGFTLAVLAAMTAAALDQILISTAITMDKPTRHFGSWDYDVSVDDMTDAKSFFVSTEIPGGYEHAFISCEPDSPTLSVFLDIRISYAMESAPLPTVWTELPLSQ